MADTPHPVGTIIGDETYVAQDEKGKEYLLNLPPGYLDLPLARQMELTAALAKLMAEVAGQKVAAHVLVWEPVLFDPSGGEGLDRPMPAVCQQFNDRGKHVALWLKVGPLSTDWLSMDGDTDTYEVKASSTDTGHGPLNQKVIPGAYIELLTVVDTDGKEKVRISCTLTPGPALSNADPLPDGDADPGDSDEASRSNHVHPLRRPSKIRYYLTDTAREVGSGDFLLATANPYDEAHAVDLSHTTGPAYWLEFVSPEGSPGLSAWPGGSIHAHLRIKMTDPQIGRTYKLYTGNGDIVYTAMIWDWTHSDTYQVKDAAPAQPSITTSYVDLDFDVPVAALAAGADGRLGLNLRMRVYVGNDEAAFANEHIIVRVGGSNASYLDTLFTPDGGFSGVHNDLDGREAANAHPMEAITPGRILWDEGATAATVDGLLTMPAKSNAVRVSGSETLLGVATAGFTPGTVIYLESAESRLVANGGTPGAGYNSLSFHNSMGMITSPPIFLWPANSGMTLKLTGGGSWLVLSAPWLDQQRALWPNVVYLTINTTTAPGLLALPSGCPGTVYVTGTALRAISVMDAEDRVLAGPLGSLKLFFANDCTLFHLDALSGWDAGLASRAGKLDLLPPAGATGDTANVFVPSRRTYRLQRDSFGVDLLWIPEVSQ